MSSRDAHCSIQIRLPTGNVASSPDTLDWVVSWSVPDALTVTTAVNSATIPVAVIVGDVPPVVSDVDAPPPAPLNDHDAATAVVVPEYVQFRVCVPPVTPCGVIGIQARILNVAAYSGTTSAMPVTVCTPVPVPLLNGEARVVIRFWEPNACQKYICDGHRTVSAPLISPEKP